MSHATTTNTRQTADAAGAHSVCPWWLGYALVSPLRRLFENPVHLLEPFVRPGMTIVEPGCGMGFFSLPLARMVGPTGRVVCVDLQQKMIDGLRRRARRAGLLDRIETVVCEPQDLRVAEWAGRVDLALAIHVVHEIPDAARFFRQVHAVLRGGGRLLVIEPAGHVSSAKFDATIAGAEAVGFTRDAAAPPTSKRLSVVLAKKQAA